MKKEKSKILKLKKKYDRLTWLKYHNFIIVGTITILSLITAGVGLLTLIPLWISLLATTSFVIGLTLLYIDKIIDCKIDIKRDKLDEKIAKLANFDAVEKQILNEYQQIKSIKKNSKLEINHRKSLIKSLIEKKNEEAKRHEKLVKILTWAKKISKEKQILKEREQELKKEIKQKGKEDFIKELEENGKIDKELAEYLLKEDLTEEQKINELKMDKVVDLEKGKQLDKEFQDKLADAINKE